MGQLAEKTHLLLLARRLSWASARFLSKRPRFGNSILENMLSCSGYGSSSSLGDTDVIDEKLSVILQSKKDQARLFPALTRAAPLE